jgi:hypothetical protein
MRDSAEVVAGESDVELLIVVVDFLVLGAGEEGPAAEQDMEDGSK